MTISQHTFRAYVGETELDVVEATVGLDEAWSPYVQGSVTIGMPDAELMAIIDPRNKVRMRLFLEQSFGESLPLSYLTSLYGGGTLADMTAAYGGKFLFELSALWFTPWNSFGVRATTRRDFYVGIRSRVIDHLGGTVTIEVTSDEGYLQDYALTSALTYAPGTATVRAAVTDALARIGAYLQAGTADGDIEANASKWLPGDSAWDYLSPLVQKAGLRLYCDEKGAFWLVDSDYAEPGQTQLTYTGTVKAADDTVDRSANNWFDAVVIRYKWTDDLGAQQTAYDIAAEPDFSKVNTLDYETEYPGPGAAQAVLNRALAKGREQSVTAVSDYSVTPTQTVSVVLPDTQTQTGYVSSVSWQFPGDEMSVSTRGLIETPVGSWDYVATGISWNSISAGISWNTYTP